MTYLIALYLVLGVLFGIKAASMASGWFNKAVNFVVLALLWPFVFAGVLILLLSIRDEMKKGND